MAKQTAIRWFETRVDISENDTHVSKSFKKLQQSFDGGSTWEDVETEYTYIS